MTLLLEVSEDVPYVPDGWNVGHLANLGLILSCSGFSARLDAYNLNLMFDLIEYEQTGEIRDHDGRILEVKPSDDGVILTPRENDDFPNGILIDLTTLREIGVEREQAEQTGDLDANEADPASEYDQLTDGDKVRASSYDPLTEGFRRTRKPKFKITRRARTSTSDLLAAFKPFLKPKVVEIDPPVSHKIVKVVRGDLVKHKKHKKTK